MKPSFIPAIFWFIVSTILLILPGSKLPGEDWMGKIWLDKWIHVGMFSIMVILWCWPMPLKKFENNKLKIIFLYFGIVWLLYGVVMELIQQYYIPNRSFDAGDIVADATGCTIGVLYSIRRYIKKN